ncbi:MAG: NADH-quinone oxidoreductase subunit C [Acidimicrobiia bacterium]
MSPSETTEDVATDDAVVEDGPLEQFAAEVAEAVGGAGHVTFGTVKVTVDADRWKESVQILRDRFGLVYFSWLSAVHWSNDVAVGEPLAEETTERYELLCTVGDLSEGKRVTLSTDLDPVAPRADSLVDVYRGADWHEREAHDMFGISFDGHPGLEPLYLPSHFAGHPLRKSYPLLSREVKPWPGKVDVEPMPDADDNGEDDEPAADPDAPSTENPEA